MGVNKKSNSEPSFSLEFSQAGKSGARPPAAIVSKSEAIRGALAEAALVAPVDTTVLLLGETGVGKEVLAEFIHLASSRRHRPMVRVNAAAIPATLIESELFGHECGAFTGAVSRRLGRFEAANESTLFLDEIGDLSHEMQVKLLRVLEQRTIERLGSCESIRVDIRIIAATNRNLEQAVRDGEFREDLFYRLNVFPITIAPLRERRADIPELARTFVEEFARRYGKNIESIAPESLRELHQYSWPGNIRELRNVIERAMVVATSSTLSPVVPGARVSALGGGAQRNSLHAV